MTDAQEFDDEPDDQPRYRDVGEIGTSDLYDALMGLAGFAENPYLAMQASQLCLVDNSLNALEEEVMRHQFDDEPPRGKIALLGALSPMWIYAAYELQRTWRQRCEEVIKLAENSGIDLKAAHLERDLGYRHYDRELRAQQLRDAQERPELIEQMRLDPAADGDRLHHARVHPGGARQARGEQEGKQEADRVRTGPCASQPLVRLDGIRAQQRWRDYQLCDAARHRRDHSVHPRGGKPERRGFGRLPGLYEPA
jgi:hypothetical protein